MFLPNDPVIVVNRLQHERDALVENIVTIVHLGTTNSALSEVPIWPDFVECDINVLGKAWAYTSANVNAIVNDLAHYNRAVAAHVQGSLDWFFNHTPYSP